jgi:uncharacterized phiE125 gp8 family phage protein
MRPPTYAPRPVLVTPPAALMDISELKPHLHVDHSDDDARIQQLLDGAVEDLDGYGGLLSRALVSQTWRADFPFFTDPLRLPLGNLVSITSVTYYDGNNAQQTLSTDVYTAIDDAIGPYLTLKPNQLFPTTYERADAVRVTWAAGYGAAAAVPEAIKTCVIMMVQRLYDVHDASELAAIDRYISGTIYKYRLNPT